MQHCVLGTGCLKVETVYHAQIRRFSFHFFFLSLLRTETDPVPQTRCLINFVVITSQYETVDKDHKVIIQNPQNELFPQSK
jgi:hypothetical protein